MEINVPLTGGNSTTFVAVVGTCDTKAEDLLYVRDLIRSAGVRALLVDVSPRGSDAPADIPAEEVKACGATPAGQPNDESDRGEAISAMSAALEAWVVKNQASLSGMIGLGGSGNTALITPGMGALPIGVPKIMVSTVASGDVAPYVGPNDIAMMYSVVDVSGLNAISRTVLGNAAHMMAGAVSHEIPKAPQADRPAIGLSMFGVTTVCVNQIVDKLQADHECFVFHATGTGGRTMEKLAENGRLSCLIDITTTEVADLLMGGVMSAGPDRMGAAIRTGLPYIGSCGALDMVNFGGIETVPERYRKRLLHAHNAQVTLMRTNAEENHEMGLWIADKLNQMNGPVRFFIPEKGVSIIDVEGAPFHDAQADNALFSALESRVTETINRSLIRLPYAINDPEFSEAIVACYYKLTGAR